MKTKKLLLIFLCQLAGINASAYDAYVNGIYYNLSEDEATVTYESNQIDWYAPYSGLVAIPESVSYRGKTYRVTGIGDHAFYSSNLVSVTIPESVTSIANAAFAFCSSLISVTIPESVTSISNDTFNRCTSLTSVTIPESVTSIGNYAFYSCKSLTSITIPERVSSIGIQVFLSCTSLSSIKVESGNTSYDSRNDCNAIIETATNTLVAGCQNTVIPNSVSSIANSAFWGCSGLTSIIIPESVTSIDIDAFRACDGLTSVTIPNSVTTIGVRAFAGCTGLTSVSIGSDLTSIGNQVFQSCSGLTSIIIPEGVTSIGREAFDGCSGMTSVTIPESVTSIDLMAFAHCSGLTDVLCYAEDVPSTNRNAFRYSPIDSATLHVPSGSVERYEANSPWKDFGNIVALAENTGDLNGDSKVDIADAVSVLNIMAGGGNNPAADLNNDGKVDIADFVSVLNLMAGQ